ncbi:MAG: alkaline phosphatase D family protein [Verrucomicrobiota bacterium]
MRRRLLPLSAPAFALLLCLRAVPVFATPYLDVGPMIGHTTERDARIWAKASESCRLAVRISTKPDLSGGSTIDGPALSAESDYMGHVVVEGLSPTTKYYYAVLFDDVPAMAAPFPSFTTAAATGAPGKTRIAFSSCVGRTGAATAAIWAEMAARTEFDVLLLLGDNHYADSTAPEVQRRFYYDQRRVLGYADIARRTPTYGIWDDHDYGPNDSDGTAAGKEISLKTFQQMWANPGYGEATNPGIYYKFSRGEIDFFMLDCRYHRSPNRTPDDGAKTMLGAAQIEWLKRELLASRAKVKFIATGSEWQPNSHIDSWKSFARERDAIFAFLREQDFPGVILLSGDRHFTGGYQIGGRLMEITSGPLGSRTTSGVNVPDMFLNLKEGTMCSVFDVDTTGAEPVLKLEVYRGGFGQIHSQTFTWSEINGRTPLPVLPPSPPQPPPAPRKKAN